MGFLREEDESQLEGSAGDNAGDGDVAGVRRGERRMTSWCFFTAAR